MGPLRTNLLRAAPLSTPGTPVLLPSTTKQFEAAAFFLYFFGDHFLYSHNLYVRGVSCPSDVAHLV